MTFRHFKTVIPETIEIGTTIRTAHKSGRGSFTKVIDDTDAVIEYLRNIGWYAVKKNDAPRGGRAGNYVEVNRKYLTKEEVHYEVMKFIHLGKNELYHGAQYYHLAVRDGEVVASLPGGVVNSRPYGYIDIQEWRDEAIHQLKEVGTIVGAYGSGGKFFVNEMYLDDAIQSGLNLKIYDVPSSYGGTHTNYEIVI